MTLTIKPAGSYEEQVFTRVMAAIPSGQAYPTSGPNPRPIQDRTAFLIEGTFGRRVRIYLNDGLVSEIGIVSRATRIELTLMPWPEINWIRIVDSAGEESSIGVTLSYMALVHYGAAIDYFRHTYLDLLTQSWSLQGAWSSRTMEFRFLYHHAMPDTTALRALGVKLTSRAVFHGSPTTLGIQNLLAALAATNPVVLALSNNRPRFDPAIWPLLPASADYGGYEFNLWLPDLPTARETALWQLATTVPSAIRVVSAEEGVTYAQVGNVWYTNLRKDWSQQNLRDLLMRIGPMDSWQAYVAPVVSVDIARRFWSYAFDNVIVAPGLGAHAFDSGELLDSGDPLDQSEPFTELWNGVAITPFDAGAELDSVVAVAVGLDEVNREPPLAFTWEYALLTGEASTLGHVTNTLHGGAIPSFETT